MDKNREFRHEPNRPSVSVIMPSYNRAWSLSVSVPTVLAQTVSDLELLIVDDGSEDDTAECIAGFAQNDDRVHYIRQSHQGVAAARNTGLRAAGGDIIAYLDSDNRWYSNYLEVMLEQLQLQSRRLLVYFRISCCMVTESGRQYWRGHCVRSSTILTDYVEKIILI